MHSNCNLCNEKFVTKAKSTFLFLKLVVGGDSIHTPICFCVLCVYLLRIFLLFLFYTAITMVCGKFTQIYFNASTNPHKSIRTSSEHHQMALLSQHPRAPKPWRIHPQRTVWFLRQNSPTRGGERAADAVVWQRVGT